MLPVWQLISELPRISVVATNIRSKECWQIMKIYSTAWFFGTVISWTYLEQIMKWWSFCIMHASIGYHFADAQTHHFNVC